MGLAVHGDLTFGHRFEQRALRLRRGAVDLVGEQQAGEDRAGMEAKLRRLALVYAHPDNVRRQQVAGELHALEVEREGGGQRMRQRGLAHPGHVFEQQVTAGDQAGEGELDLTRLAQQYLVDLGQRGIEPAQQGIIAEWSGGHVVMQFPGGAPERDVCVIDPV